MKKRFRRVTPFYSSRPNRGRRDARRKIIKKITITITPGGNTTRVPVRRANEIWTNRNAAAESKVDSRKSTTRRAVRVHTRYCIESYTYYKHDVQTEGRP